MGAPSTPGEAPTDESVGADWSDADMRKLIVTEFITLDGVVEDPGEKVKLELVEHAAYANGVTLQVLDVVH